MWNLPIIEVKIYLVKHAGLCLFQEKGYWWFLQPHACNPLVSLKINETWNYFVSHKKKGEKIKTIMPPTPIPCLWPPPIQNTMMHSHCLYHPTPWSTPTALVILYLVMLQVSHFSISLSAFSTLCGPNFSFSRWFQSREIKVTLTSSFFWPSWWWCFLCLSGHSHCQCVWIYTPCFSTMWQRPLPPNSLLVLLPYYLDFRKWIIATHCALSLSPMWISRPKWSSRSLYASFLVILLVFHRGSNNACVSLLKFLNSLLANVPNGTFELLWHPT